MNSRECAEIDDQLEELALGEVPEPERTRLLAHVAECGQCRSQLDGILGLTDSLLALSPQQQPPPGFESRVLDRLGLASAPAVGRRVRWLLAAAASLVLVAALLGGVALGRRADGSHLSVVRSGAITRADGSRVGAIQLVRAVHPYALVTIERPQPGTTNVTCELQLADGGSVTIGSWAYDDVKAGVWAVGLDEALLDAVSMHVVDGDGNVVASAVLD